VAEWRGVVLALGLQGTGGGHDLEIAKIAIPAHTAHVSETETFDGGMLIGIARPIVAAGDGVGAELHQPEGPRRAGEGLAFAELGIGARPNHRIDKIHRFSRRTRGCHNDKGQTYRRSGNEGSSNQHAAAQVH